MIESRLAGAKPIDMVREQVNYDTLASAPGGDPNAPFTPGVEAKQSLNNYLTSNVVEPLATRGWPNLGAALATAPMVAADMVVPETKGELAGMAMGPVRPSYISKIVAGRFEEVPIEELVRIQKEYPGLFRGKDSPQFKAAMEQNVLESIASAIQQKKSRKLAGADMQSYDVGDGVMLKMAKNDDARKKLDQRFFLEQQLAEDEISPESIVFKYEPKQQGLLQDKATAFLNDDFSKPKRFDLFDSPSGNWTERRFLNEGVSNALTNKTRPYGPFDVRPANIARFRDWQPEEIDSFKRSFGAWKSMIENGKPYTRPFAWNTPHKIIDAGQFTGNYQPGSRELERDKWKIVNMLKGKK